MGIFNSSDILQENISELFEGLDMVHAYIDDVLVINKNNVEDHIKALDRVIQRLAEAGLKVNVGESFFRQTATGYIGFWVHNNGVILL